MVLTDDELRSLVELRHSSPHTLLGMHPLGDGKGLVVRALLPDAAKVEIQPTHEKSKPKFALSRISDTDVFEGATPSATRVYAYDLIVTDHQGGTRCTRDAFSFLPTLGESDLFLFGKGDERRIYEKLGAQLRTIDGVPGVSFAVWAPNAQRVSVVGDFNHWDGRFHPLRLLAASGVWEIFVPGAGQGAHYKFEIRDAQGKVKLHTDPYGFFFEVPPKNAAIVWDNRKMQWTDDAWMRHRRERDALRAPLSIYEIHIGSWQKKSAAESWSYRELAKPLAEYVRRMGFTHVEFLPAAEHAFYPSWGYQITGFYAPTSRYGSPDDFQYLVNALHEAGLGVIVDWVPAHFPRDDWALARFDGTALYEHEDPRKGAHQDWGTLIFNYGRHEVNNFLTANALYWCDRFHMDGLRVDAVASMLYLDYSRQAGQWIPNRFGGRENLEAIEFLKKFNHLTHVSFPGVLTIAEESTAWPLVTRRPTSAAWASPSNGTWAGCTTRWVISAATRFIASIIKTTSPLRCSITTTKTSSSRCRTTRWSTANARSWAGCRGRTGNGSPTFGLCSAINGCFRARSFCSWAANLAKAPSGMPTASSIGGSWMPGPFIAASKTSWRT